MKQIIEYIESNKKLLEEARIKLNNTTDESEIKRLTINIERFDYYIKGLEDAKKIIEEEKEEL